MPCSQCGRPDDYHWPRVVSGVGRVADNPKAILITLTREVTDDDIRKLPDVLRWYGVTHHNEHVWENGKLVK